MLIASEPLTLDEAWFKIPNKTLVIINSDLKTKIIKVSELKDNFDNTNFSPNHEYEKACV